MASFTEQNVPKVHPRSRLSALRGLFGPTPTPSWGWTAFCLSVGPLTYFPVVSALLAAVDGAVVRFPWKEPLTCFQFSRMHTQERGCWVMWILCFHLWATARLFPIRAS